MLTDQATGAVVSRHCRIVPRAPNRLERPVRLERPSAVAQDGRATGRSEIGAVHKLILAAVWITFATSGVVFSEPAPVDVLIVGLIALLPAAGIVLLTPRLAVFAALWGLVAAGGLVASTMSGDMQGSTVFTLVSIYLYAAAVITAAFIAWAPKRHADLILSAWLMAGLATAVTGILGYFALVPGAADVFTRFGRASGTFKDPNVMGAFLVAPFLYALHLALNASASRAIWMSLAALACAGLLALATVLTMSRGAWLNLAAGLALYTALSWTTAATAHERKRIMTAVLAGAGVLVLVTAALLQDDRIAKTLSDRATLTQSYDEGPEGRFGGQLKAFDLLIVNPAGIGAGEFQRSHHYEDVHNVYLSVFLNNGWLGGFAYWIVVAATLVIGTLAMSGAKVERHLLVIAIAAFAATALEGLVIDTDHWRSFYLLAALVWGLAAYPHHQQTVERR